MCETHFENATIARSRGGSRGYGKGVNHLGVLTAQVPIPVTSESMGCRLATACIIKRRNPAVKAIPRDRDRDNISSAYTDARVCDRGRRYIFIPRLVGDYPMVNAPEDAGLDQTARTRIAIDSYPGSTAIL